MSGAEGVFGPTPVGDSDTKTSRLPAPSHREVKTLSLALYGRLEEEPGFRKGDEQQRKALDSAVRYHTGYTLLCCVLLIIATAVSLAQAANNGPEWYASAYLLGWLFLLAALLVIGLCLKSWAFGVLGLESVVDRLREQSSDERKQTCRELLSAVEKHDWIRRIAHWLWPDLALIRPFSFHNIWWWTLVLGVIRLSFAYVNDSKYDLNKYAQDITAALVVSAIAFIASNLVSQLLSLKDKFQTVQEKVETSNSEVGALTKNIAGLAGDLTAKLIGETTKLTDNLKTQAAGLTETLRSQATDLARTSSRSLHALESAAAMLDVFATWKRLRERLSEEMALKLWGNLIKTLNNLVDQVDKGKEGVPPYLTTVLSHFLDAQEKLLNTQEQRIVTPFVNVGRMARAIMAQAAKERGWVAYALLVLPPLKFLNYNDLPRSWVRSSAGGAPEDDGRGLSDHSWWQYLNENWEISKPESQLTVQRYFVSVSLRRDVERIAFDDDQEQDSVLGKGMTRDAAFRLLDEMRPIRTETIMRQLSHKVLCDKRGLPWAIDSSPALGEKAYVKWEDVGLRMVHSGMGDPEGRPQSSMRFVVDEKGECLIPEEIETDAKWKSVEAVLGTIFHRPGNAFVVTYDQNVDETLALLVDPQKRKLKDFFALGKKVDGQVEWHLCLRSLYDRDFDVADVEILHAGGDATRWEKARGELDQIFIIESSHPSLSKRLLKDDGV